MRTVFKVHLRSGNRLTSSDLPGVKLESLDLLDIDTMRLTVQGDGADAARLLKTQKNKVSGYEVLRQISE